ncbi:MAG: YXWGXW repeat-containing protein [Burkholderiales bacterium]|nr:YXWGXW repeat-containing protein [Burkholderiales bacterium]
MKRSHTIRNLLLSASLAGAIFAAPAYAQISFNISVAPPAPQYEVVPTVAPGYVWAPGYWGWSGDRHVWVRGRTIMHREGYRWEPDRWDQRSNGYYRTVGHWEHDKSYKAYKVKKEKKHKGWKHDNGKRGKGKKHGN